MAAIEVELESSGVTRTEWAQGLTASINLQMPHHLMSKALQECPKSGVLWASAIFLEPKAAQVNLSFPHVRFEFCSKFVEREISRRLHCL